MLEYAITFSQRITVLSADWGWVGQAACSAVTTLPLFKPLNFNMLMRWFSANTDLPLYRFLHRSTIRIQIGWLGTLAAWQKRVKS
jgi:hypothetical protein